MMELRFLPTLGLSSKKSTCKHTGLSFPEGPHIHKEDAWYYRLIAEDGIELGRRATVARPQNIRPIRR